MFRYLESLIDPFARDTGAAPSNHFRHFLIDHLRPFRKVLPVVAVTGFTVALV